MSLHQGRTPRFPRRAPRAGAGLRAAALAAVCAGLLLACSDGSGGGSSGGSSSAGGGEPTALAQVLRWNQIAVDTSGVDHMPSDQGPPHVQGEQLGPCRAARAMAIVHIAMFEALLAIDGGYRSYVGLGRAAGGESRAAAVAQAAHDTLVALFPSQAGSFDQALADDLARVPDGPAEADGVALGKAAAAAILAMRANDGSDHPEPVLDVDYFCDDDPGYWRQDPISQVPIALGAHWSLVRPFLLASADQFRAPAMPLMDTPEYTFAYEEAKALGGDGIGTPTARTEEETLVGIYWAYDGTPSLCAPPRLYNQLAVLVGTLQGVDDALQMARLLALANTAMADTGIAVWESKYFYECWRPVAAVREADRHTGPTGLGDGNRVTLGDGTWTPLGAPASNSAGPNFTPPFPAYPSGHAGFGGALFQVLRRFLGTDDVAFTFTSDELNGVTVDNEGNPRPLLPRTFQSLSQAEEENGQSRIYLGIHWSFDKTAGIAQGNSVADYVLDSMYPPAR